VLCSKFQVHYNFSVVVHNNSTANKHKVQCFGLQVGKSKVVDAPQGHFSAT
jgi:hypothetical protein